jgi:hypothetical protein
MVLSPFRQLTEQTACIITGLFCFDVLKLLCNKKLEENQLLTPSKCSCFLEKAVQR